MCFHKRLEKEVPRAAVGVELFLRCSSKRNYLTREGGWHTQRVKQDIFGFQTEESGQIARWFTVIVTLTGFGII